MLRTERDHQILDALARKVRLLTIDQIATSWWEATRVPVPNARRRLEQLTAAGYVAAKPVHVSPRIPLTEPLVAWRQGMPVPDFGPIAWKLQSRWPQHDRREGAVERDGKCDGWGVERSGSN